MKTKILFLGALLLTAIFINAQLRVNDLEQGKKLALATGKFLLLDFNADWCMPCKKMDADYFSNGKYKADLDKFIIVSIDIDSEKALAARYGIKSIPYIFVVDTAENQIYKEMGYTSAEESNTDLAAFPSNAKFLYSSLQYKDPKMPTDVELVMVASAYEGLLQLSKNTIVKRGFGDLSDEYFTKIKKVSKDPSLVELSQVSLLYNKVLTDHPKPVIKKLNPSVISEKNQPFAYYVLAKAYFQNKDKESAMKQIEAINQSKSEQWISAAKMLEKKYSE